MRISSPTGGRSGRSTLGRCARGLASFLLVAGAAAPAAAQEGQILCSITENASPGRGTLLVEQSGKRVASGSCGRPVSAPPGPAKVTLRLEGALDNPTKIVDVRVAAGETVPVTVDFKTATLEVRIETKGQRGTGLVAVEKDGKRIGTIGAGVGARLSAGEYLVVVRLGGEERRYQVDLRPGQRRLVRAQF